jgi:hypothetical protein
MTAYACDKHLKQSDHEHGQQLFMWTFLPLQLQRQKAEYFSRHTVIVPAEDFDYINQKNSVQTSLSYCMRHKVKHSTHVAFCQH